MDHTGYTELSSDEAKKLKDKLQKRCMRSKSGTLFKISNMIQGAIMQSSISFDEMTAMLDTAPIIYLKRVDGGYLISNFDDTKSFMDYISSDLMNPFNGKYVIIGSKIHKVSETLFNTNISPTGYLDEIFMRENVPDRMTDPKWEFPKETFSEDVYEDIPISEPENISSTVLSSKNNNIVYDEQRWISVSDENTTYHYSIVLRSFGEIVTDEYSVTGTAPNIGALDILEERLKARFLSGLKKTFGRLISYGKNEITTKTILIEDVMS